MIPMRPMSVINERRIFRSIQPYMEGDAKCSLKWILGVIASDKPIAARLLRTRFAQYANTQRYRELEEALSTHQPQTQ